MFIRSKHNPIIKPDVRHSWESRKVYNPAVICERGKYHLFYRAVGDNWTSSIGYATSVNGERFIRSKAPIMKPGSKLESRGVEDPRLTKIGKKYFLTYTAYDGKCARLSLAVSTDLVNWQKHGPMLPDWNFKKAGGFLVKWDAARMKKPPQTNWSKAGGIFPEKVSDQFLMLFGDSNIWLARSSDGQSWRAENKPFLKPRGRKFFDSAHIEMGPPPIKTRAGWLVLYHGIDQSIVYRLYFLLLDLNNPSKILYRSSQPIFEPSASYELNGLVDILPGGLAGMKNKTPSELKDYLDKIKTENKMPLVIFCNGAAVKNNVLRIFYGAGDSLICTATAKLARVLKFS